MNRKSSGSGSNQKMESNLFSGSCTHCGEVYETKSGVENLEGITFKCKKMFCDGRVTLAFSRSPNPEPTNHGNDRTPDPRRYC